MKKSFEISKIKESKEQAEEKLEKIISDKENLKECKQALVETIGLVESSGMDEDLKSKVIDDLNNRYKEIQNEAKEKNKELDEYAKKMDDIKMETVEAEEETQDKINSMNSQNAVLEKIGVTTMADSISETETNLQEIRETRESIQELLKKMMECGQELDTL